MRHGDTDWQQVEARGWRGPLNDFAPLTERGRQQARQAADAFAPGLDLVVSSPMTRAVETACVLSAVLDAPVRIALDLREWLPDETLSWATAEEVRIAYADMLRHGGVRPEGHPLRWEPLPAVQARARAAIAALPRDLTILVVCHAVVIYALTGQENTEHCGVVAYSGM